MSCTDREVPHGRIRRQNRSLAQEERRDAVVLEHQLRQLLPLGPGVPLRKGGTRLFTVQSLQHGPLHTILAKNNVKNCLFLINHKLTLIKQVKLSAAMSSRNKDFSNYRKIKILKTKLLLGTKSGNQSLKYEF